MRVKFVFILLFVFSFTGHSQTTSEVPCKLGVTLSGGAARGFAHIGILRALDEAGIEIDCISGSSMGALVGLFYAAGKTPDEIMEIAKSIKKRKLTNTGSFHFGKRGLDYVEQLLKKHIEQTRFEELQKPLYICVTNLQTGQYEVISTGEIMTALLASVAIPFKFKQQFIDGVPYIDGGVVNNLPVEPVRNTCRVVMGFSVNPIAYKSGKISIRDKIVRVTELMIHENEAHRIAMCDYHLEVPGLEVIDFEDYERADEIHDMGYHAAQGFIEQNPQLVQYYQAIGKRK